ncbi:hypothetical protein L0Y65_07150 [Candidatus Micrarchaeota archaeon]|nr:hypothetical protein [Candidatus Micrarchaeota archaeon]
MEYQHKLLLVSAILVAVALYVVFTMPAATPPANSTEAEMLLMKGAGFGKNLDNYTYAYNEVSDGYKTAYLLMAAGGERYIEITNPLSIKRIYMGANDTVFCIRYPVNESCVSVQNNSEMQNYIAFSQSKFFNNTNILKAESSMEELIGKGYLHAEAEISDKSVGGADCSEVTYVIDYSNATVSDAALFGIGAQSPKVYDLTRCIEPGKGLAYETTLRYEEGNLTHEKVTTVALFREGAPSIPPLPELGGNAMGAFRNEREQQVKLATCHTGMRGDERDKCVADAALNLKRRDLCDLAGGRRDRCLVALVPLTKDTAICAAIASMYYKDDCFIELAGAYKNASYCSQLQNSSKLAFCEEAAAPRAQQDGGSSDAPDGNEAGGSATNQSASTTGSETDEVDIQGLLEYVEKYNESAQ